MTSDVSAVFHSTKELFFHYNVQGLSLQSRALDVQFKKSICDSVLLRQLTVVGGLVTKNNSSTLYAFAGEKVYVHADSVPGMKFLVWEGNGQIADPEVDATFIMMPDSDVVITALFEEDVPPLPPPSYHMVVITHPIAGATTFVHTGRIVAELFHGSYSTWVRNEVIGTQSPYVYMYRELSQGLSPATMIDFLTASARSTSPALGTRGNAFLYVLRNVNKTSGNMPKQSKSSLTSAEATYFKMPTGVPPSIAQSSQWLGQMNLTTGNFDMSGYTKEGYQIPRLGDGEDLWFVFSSFS